MKSINIILLIFAVFAISLFTSCEENDTNGDVLFNYEIILDKVFKKNVGDVIPVTIEKSIEMDGVFSNNGLYFYYSSDKNRGNYDIYLRDLRDITTIRLTDHASKDTAPAISSDGKYLVFVSEREDPEGDIYIVRIKPGKLIKQKKKTTTEVPTVDTEAINISQFQDLESRAIKIIKDASPSWSPDSDMITFSSTRNGIENIWIMDRDGENKRQITKKGGMYPRFSRDGKKIIFISYRNKKSNGDIYTVNVLNGVEKQITETGSIELHPSFMNSNNEIIYTLIDRDTNKNGKIDLRDNSVVYYKNLGNGLEYPLTLYSESSFNPLWTPVFTKWSKDIRGIIIYSNQIGENININILPEYGLIPKKKNARLQVRLAERYLNEFDDMGKYLMALEKVYHYFGRKTDLASIVYTTNALTTAALINIEKGKKEEAKRIQKIVSGMTKKKNVYSEALANYINNVLTTKSGEKSLNAAVNDIEKNKENKKYSPYLLEKLGDEFTRLKKTDKSVGIYKNLLAEYPKYKRAMFIHYKLGINSYRNIQEDLSPSIIKVLGSSYSYLRNYTISYLIDIFSKESNLNKLLRISKNMLKKYEDKKKVPELIQYITGETYYRKHDYKKAKKHLTNSLELIKVPNLVFYKSNSLLGRIAENEKNFNDMEKYYSDSANKYKRIWKQDNYKPIINKLIEYYEEYGDRAEAAGDYKTAVGLYKKYVFLMTSSTFRKLCSDLYNEYGPRSHVLYIDTYSEWKKNKYKELLKLEKEYTVSKYNIKNARLSSDKAFIYGFGYIYTRIALALSKRKESLLDNVTDLMKNDLEDELKYFRKSIEQTEWALFIDDTFIDPDILRGWIYQYIDEQRIKDIEKNDGENIELYSQYFPKYLWEKNISIYEKAIEINNEGRYPEKEGNLHLNIANSHFLLSNYPKALTHYKLARKYKKNFGSSIEEALFHYHLGYCYWQNSELDKAKNEMSHTLYIYTTLASGNTKRYKHQIFYLYKFFALFERLSSNYSNAITWYNKIMEFATRNKIKIDKARYLQEIAYCYKETGQYNNAFAYISKADKKLKKYTVDEKNYYPQMGFFGLKPINFILYDLGPDNVIFGDNRINSELDTIQKRLLNISIEEDMHYTAGNLEKAIRSLKKKIEIIDERNNKFERDIKIRTLNNIGFCYFRLNRFKEAGEYFKKTWDYSIDPDVNDLDGTFIAIMNNANLYAFLLESDTDSLNDPEKEIDSLIKRIIDYRESYEKKRFEKEMKSLKETAEKQKREISSEEIEGIKDAISKEAKDKYYTLDIAIGILTYYKAELVRINNIKKESQEKTKAVKTAYNHYEFNRNLFSLYSDAIKRFESALIKAEARQSKKMAIKLLLNIAACQKRIGLFDDAYATYSNAEKQAKLYEYNKLIWKVYYQTASFLIEYGGNIDKGQYLNIAEDYLANSVKRIEELPYLYIRDAHTIKKLYDDYINLLLRQNKHNSALVLSEKKYELWRLSAISLSPPDFFNENDNRIFSDYQSIMNDIGGLQREISLSLEMGDQESAQELKAKIKKEMAALNRVIKNAGKSNPLVASYISISKSKIPFYKDAVIYKLHKFNGSLYCWKIVSGKAVFIKLIELKDGEKNITSSIKEVIKKDKSNKHKFVILDRTSLEIFQDFKTIKASFMFIPSVERARYFMKPNNVTFNSIYYSGQGLKDVLSEKKILSNAIINENLANEDLSKYSIIIDEKDELNASILFSKRLEPALFMKSIHKTDIGTISILSEAALYSGIKSLFLYNTSADLEFLSKFLKESKLKNFSQISPDFVSFIVALSIGFRGIDMSVGLKNIGDIKKSEFRKYEVFLNSGRPDDALLHLNKWHAISGTDIEKENVIYPLKMAEIEFIKGNYDNSFMHIEAAVKAAKKTPDLMKDILFTKIYLFLYTGKIDEAESLLKNIIDNDLKKYIDYKLFKYIIDLITTGKTPSFDYHKKILLNKSVLNINKLNFLFAEYLGLHKKHGYAARVLTNWRPDYPTNDREIIKASVIINSNNTINQLSDRARKILLLNKKISEIEAYKSKARLLLENEGRYDTLSPAAALITLNKLISERQLDSAFALIDDLDVQEMKARGHWTDSINLFIAIYNICRTDNRNEIALRYVKLISDLIKNKELPVFSNNILYNEAVTLTLLGKYKESYDIARRGHSLNKGDQDLKERFNLLLLENELYLGKIKDAVKRIETTKEPLAPEYEYIYGLLKSRITLLKIIQRKKAIKGEWNIVEKLILQSLNYLDSTPDILSKFNRIDIVNESINMLITHKMNNGKLIEALLLAEINKQLHLRSRFPYLTWSGKISSRIIKEFKDVKKEKDIHKFKTLLRQYPLLQINALTSMLPVKDFQQTIPGNAVTLYLTANSKDIMAWIISNRKIKGVIIKNGYSRAKEIVENYRAITTLKKNTINVSKDLYKLFKPLEKYYKDKKMIIFITGKDLETVPFEIIGKRDLLEETHTIVYLSSILSTYMKQSTKKWDVNLISSNKNPIINDLELVSIKESGIPYKKVNIMNSGIGHLHSKIFIDSLNGTVYIGDHPLIEIVKGASIIYIPQFDRRSRIGYNEFSLHNSMNGVNGVIVNDSIIHDVNNAIFVDNFYNNINRGLNLISAFQKAKEKLRHSKRFTYPSYWAGIRLYLNGI